MQGDMLTASLVTCKAKSFCTLLKNYWPYCLNRSSKCAAVVRHPTKDGWPQVWYRAHRLRINDRGMCSADRRIRSNDTGLFSRRKKKFYSVRWGGNTFAKLGNVYHSNVTGIEKPGIFLFTCPFLFFQIHNHGRFLNSKNENCNNGAYRHSYLASEC
jgi:hypothetical protein